MVRERLGVWAGPTPPSADTTERYRIRHDDELRSRLTNGDALCSVWGCRSSEPKEGSRAPSHGQADAIRSSHGLPESSLQLLMGAPTRHWLEHVDYANPIQAEPIRIQDGYAPITDSPGSGIDWNEEIVGRLVDNGALHR
jgi:hypothetical protein